jgi:hypothetical protein
MTPARRRTATPASQGPTRTAPDVPIVADPTPDPAETKDSTQLLGPEGGPLAQKASSKDARGDSAPSTETKTTDSEDRPAAPSRRRPLSLYPLPVWPD